MVTTNGLSTVLSLCRYLGLIKTIPNKDTTTRENIGTGDGSETIFWLDNLGVIENTYAFSYGSSEASLTTLTETTHYTLDLETSKLTLTGTGVTAVGTDNIYGEYKYNSQEFTNQEFLDALNAAETKILKRTEMTFADSSTTDPAYRKIITEPIKGHYNPYDKVFDLNWGPTVRFVGTVNGAYTTGGVTITLNDGGGLPTAGTLYIGGNKVAYSGRSTNNITVPSTTPSIADAAIVRGEVIEISMEPEGSATNYVVLDPDTEYEIDYAQGRIKILSNAYLGEITGSDRIYPSNYLLQVTYFHAWHEKGADPTIPDEIEYVTNMIASRRLMGSIVAKAHNTGLNDFNPALVNVDEDAISEILDHYTLLNVGTSFYNKQSLS